jgi:hypothetical protein
LSYLLFSPSPCADSLSSSRPLFSFLVSVCSSCWLVLARSMFALC